MLSKSEVEHIANLARIELNTEEIKKYQEQLGRILDYMEKLKEIDTSNVPASNGGTLDLENVWRSDEQKLGNKEIEQLRESEILINMAPEVEKGQVKVKSVF